MVGLGLTGFGLYHLLFQTQAHAAPLCEELGSSDLSTSSFVVAVMGAVERPGVVSVAPGQRWVDAVQLAGGVTSTADAYFLNREFNLAREVQDGEQIYIPFAQERTTGVGGGGTASSAAQSAQSAEAVGAKRISINSASQLELQHLEGVGEKRAADIIAGRPYQQLEDLVTRGILTQNLFTKNQKSMQL